MSGYDSQIPYQPIEEPIKKNRSNQHFDKLSVGAGSQRFEVNVKDGLWMGADTFVDGKFSVDFSGGVIASSILIKNSNGDTLINSNASADFVNVINSKLNTNTQKLLKDFTFDGYTGAFKTGAITWNTTTGEITGGTGGIFFSDGLIFAKNGTPTIVLDGVTGDAIFSGTLTAASGSLGAITIGTNAWHVDSSGNIWWGNYANYSSAIIKISSSGVANLVGANISGTLTITGGSGIANLSDSGNLATLDSVGASNCDTTIISGGVITTGLLTGATLQTSTSGYRVVITSTNGVGFFNSGTELGRIQSDASGDIHYYSVDDHVFSTNGTNRWQITNGELTPMSNNAYNIGTDPGAGGKAVKNIFAIKYYAGASGTGGATGTFKDYNNKTITVIGGIITNIAT